MYLRRRGCYELVIGPCSERIVDSRKCEPECDMHGRVENFPIR